MFGILTILSEKQTVQSNRNSEKIMCCPYLTSPMSGSPILQDGRLVGAVTHVLIDDPARGYGILIENMLAAA